MARRAPQPSLSPKMLKHFAIATCAITACLALFADGEGRNEFGREVAAQGHGAETAVVAATERVKPKFSINNQIRDARRTYVPFAGEDGDSGAAYGAPMDGGGGSGGGGGGFAGNGGPRFPEIPPPAAQPPSNESARGGPLEPGKFLPGQGGAQPKGPGPRQPRRPTTEEAERLQAMSLQRSGNS